MTVVGPFTQLVPMAGLPEAGPIPDSKLTILTDSGILIKNGMIKEIGSYKELCSRATDKIEITQPCVALPGFIDCHTHICFAGSRAGDYAKRLSGISYQQIAAEGGGILETVRQTRAASMEELEILVLERAHKLMRQGVTTCEVKSGYGLNLNDELKMVRAIDHVRRKGPIDLIATCLAAHTRPPEFKTNQDYLDFVAAYLLPAIMKEKLSHRVDIFVEEKAFGVEEARTYLLKAIKMGFEITIHADQFSRGGAQLAAELHARSADHLEESNEQDAKALAAASVTATVLPGAALGLGIPFPPARMLLDHGAAVAIASDWNPGSAPMGQLLLQAAVLGAQQKLSMAETFSAITYRAAKALNLNDRGRIAAGFRADVALFPAQDYRQILYHQGSLQPFGVISAGKFHS